MVRDGAVRLLTMRSEFTSHVTTSSLRNGFAVIAGGAHMVRVSKDGHDEIADTHTSAFSPRENARVRQQQLPSRKEGAGNAGCALHPQSRVQK
jgi:hypothetical protein